MALPNRNSSQQQSRPASVGLRQHRTEQPQHASGLNRAASRPAPRRPQRPQQSVQQPEPEPELDFDDGMESGAYDDNAYVDEPVRPVQQPASNAYMQAAPQKQAYPAPLPQQPAQPDYSSYQQPQQDYQQPVQQHAQPVQQSSFAANVASANMESAFDNVSAAQAFVAAAGTDTLPEHDDNKQDKKPKKRQKYNRNNKSVLKSDGTLSESSAKMWRYGFLAIMILIFLVGLKNAIIPPKTLSEADVQNVVMQTTGETGFPLEQGATIAQAFAEAYIPISGDSAAQSMLANFYAGQKFDSSNSNTIQGELAPTSSESLEQKIKSGPFIYKQQALDAKTANYVVGMLVYKTSNGQPVTDDKSKNVIYKWLYLNIGVYYDSKTSKFYIDKTSPTIVSEPVMGASADLPSIKEPGNGKTDETVTTDAKDAVIQFMKAWGAGDSSSLSTLVSKDHTANATDGLNGNYTLSDDSSSIQFEAYGDPGDGYYRGLVTVKWVDAINGSSQMTDSGGNQSNAPVSGSVTYTSRYIIKLKKEASGKYSIQDINPYYYVPQAGEEINESSESSE